MFFQQQLLHILKKYDGQRTVFSAYHLLKGKKSGQTIQDVGLFNLQPYFYLLPKLTKEAYSEIIQELQATNKILIDDEQKITVLQSEMEEPSYFDGWHFRGGELIFFQRLQLIVQTVSNHIQGENRFLPIIREDSVQYFVRHYLLHIRYQDEKQRQRFITQLHEAVAEMEVDDIVRTIILYRLTGYGHIGMTWSQLAQQFELNKLDVQLYFVHGMHRMIEQIEKGDFDLLKVLLHQVRVQTVLTESTQKTVRLLQNGLTLQQIAVNRRLKESTIEDHIAEIAMNDPHFNVSPFMTKEIAEEIRQVILQIGSKKLKPIKDRLPEATYFQIRLILAMIGGEKNA